jgi:hypothetical protein
MRGAISVGRYLDQSFGLGLYDRQVCQGRSGHRISAARANGSGPCGPRFEIVVLQWAIIATTLEHDTSKATRFLVASIGANVGSSVVRTFPKPKIGARSEGQALRRRVFELRAGRNPSSCRDGKRYFHSRHSILSYSLVFPVSTFGFRYIGYRSLARPLATITEMANNFARIAVSFQP